MKNKFLLSVVASALLTSAAYAVAPGAGTLNLSAGNASTTLEYKEKYGSTLSNSIGTIDYTANILGSGSVSDALVRLDLTDTNLSSTTLADIDAGFAVGPTVIKDEDNVTVAIYDKKIVTGIAPNQRTYFLFNGDAATSIVDGIHYRFATEDNVSSTITYALTSSTGTIKLDVFSTSGTEDDRDLTEASLSTSVTNQFTTSCIAKFDGLINIESLQDSFVNTAHDNDVGDATDGLSQWDTLVFTVNNNDAGQSLDGNASAITIQTRNADGTTINVDNNFSNTAIWNPTIVAIQADGTRPTYTMVHSLDATTLATLTTPATPTTLTQGIMSYTTDGNLTFVLPNTKIPSGITTYYIGLGHTATAGGIKPVKFVNGRLALEAGLADNNNSLYPAGNVPRGASQDAGEWMNHAYISQIPAGESGGQARMSTRYFITNRSCAVATPQINVIYAGKVYAATNVAELPIDTQSEYSLKDIMSSIPALAGVWNDDTSTKVSVEITLPGIAEDFYIYAQVKNKSINQFKDLPVYSTSERD